ncbi:MAG: hypothetical protein ACLTKG_01715 [Collinsella intestinalis]
MLNNVMLLIGITLVCGRSSGALGGVISSARRRQHRHRGHDDRRALAGAAVSFYRQPLDRVPVRRHRRRRLRAAARRRRGDLRADQNVSGIALSMLGPGLALFLAASWDGGTQALHRDAAQDLRRGALPAPWANLNVDVTVVFGIIAAAAVWFVLYKTSGPARPRRGRAPRAPTPSAST